MPKEIEFYDDWQAILTELEGQSDRGAAIVGVALLDSRMKEVFKAHFIRTISKNELKKIFDEPVSPLGSYSAKARVAHALGIIGPQSFADLKILGKIRNRFAHWLEVRDFGDSQIADWCSGLRLADVGFEGEPAPSGPRERFLRSVANIAHLLYSEFVAGSPLGESATKSP